MERKWKRLREEWKLVLIGFSHTRERERRGFHLFTNGTILLELSADWVLTQVKVKLTIIRVNITTNKSESIQASLQQED